MSASLGPIHYWLYNKIKVQEDLVDELLTQEETKLGSEAGLRADVYSRYGEGIKGKLEDVIDPNNIHRWLQLYIDKVEYKLAYTVTALLKGSILALEDCRNIFKSGGAGSFKLWGKEEYTPEILYKGIFDHLLEGMPCDHIHDILSCDEREIAWRKLKCIHQSYWDAVEGDIKNYYSLREAWINGFLENTLTSYAIGADGVERIKKE